METKTYTVSEISNYIKHVIEDDEYLSYIRISGEVSDLYMPKERSRHIYFSLKDDESKIKCIIFSNHLSNIPVFPQNGMKLVVEGRVGIYEKRGEYSLYIYKLETQGIGEFKKAFEELKRKLENEGLFAMERKRAIPQVPKKIGIITSINGAAIRDIIKNSFRRFSNIHFIVFPVYVQGARASIEIVRAFDIINNFYNDLDFVILARGGGSIDELWTFNEEIVARAIYSSVIPVVSAIGHERDVTISDLVADLRVSTPSMASEETIPEKDVLISKIFSLREKMNMILMNRIDLKKNHILNILNMPFYKNSKNEIVYTRLNKLGTEVKIFQNLFKNNFNKKKELLSTTLSKFSSLNPLKVLERGYSITYKYPDNIPLTNATDISKNDKLKTILKKGEIISLIIDGG